MNVTQESTADTLTIHLEGELDVSSSVGFDQDVLSAPDITRYRRVLIDCTRLEYIASAGVGVFISHLKRFEEAGTTLVFYGMQERVYNVFEILGLDALMTIVGSAEEAQAVPYDANA